MASVGSEVLGGVEGEVTVSCFPVGESVAGEEGEETTIVEVVFVLFEVSPSSFFPVSTWVDTFSTVSVVVVGTSSAFTGGEEGASESIVAVEG